MTRLIMLSATVLGVGYLPIMPGTFGSLIALPLHHFLTLLPLKPYALALFILGVVAVLAAGSAEKILDRKDPSPVVIDEVLGMLITLAGTPRTIPVYILGFFLFRLFDIWKPFPIGWIDRRVQGGVGIVLDDLLAGLYANLLLRLIWEVL